MATTYHVKVSGNDGNVGSDGSPFLTISKGVSVCVAGDTLEIHVGTYTGAINTIDSQTYTVPSGSSGNPITIMAHTGDVVTIQPPDNYSGIRLTTSNPTYLTFQDLIFDGVNHTTVDQQTALVYTSGGTSNNTRFIRLEVKNSYDFGFQLGTHGNVLQACLIHDNGNTSQPNTNGHGIYIGTQSNTVEDCFIYNNKGMGCQLNSGSDTGCSYNIIRRNTCYNNGARSSTTGVSIVMARGVDIQCYNNVVYQTDSRTNLQGIKAYTNSSNCQIYNNTVYGHVSYDGIAMEYYLTAPRLTNNISYNNAINIHDYGGTGTPIQVTNLTTNPSFVDAASGNFRLLSGSAARDTGTSLSSVFTTDFDGATRPQGGGWDIGAFEFSDSFIPPDTPTTYYLSTTGNDSNNGLTDLSAWATFAYAGSQMAAGDTLIVLAGTYAEQIDGADFPNGTDWTAGSGAIVIKNYPSHAVWISIIGGSAGLISLISKSYFIIDGIHVYGNAMTDGPNIQITSCDHIRIQNSSNLNAARSGILVEQTAGPISYLEFITLNIRDGGRNASGSSSCAIKVGAEAANPTGTDLHCLIDGCECRGFTGLTNDAGIQIYGGGQNDRLGGWVIKNNKLALNSVGAYLSDVTTVPTLFYNNTVRSNTLSGVILFEDDKSRIYNNTFNANGGWAIEVGTNGAVVDALISNNSLSSNTSGPIKIFNTSGTSKATITYNNLNGNGNGNAILDQNALSTVSNGTTVSPGYVDASTADFALLEGSAMINIGTTIATVTTDQVGMIRPQGSAYDIGAFERAALTALSVLRQESLSVVDTPPQRLMLPLREVVRLSDTVTAAKVAMLPGTAVLVQARSGIERANASRTNYFTVNSVMTLNGVNISTKVQVNSLHVTNILNDAADTASFSVKPGSGFTPTNGQSVSISLGSVENAIFAGTVARVTHRRLLGQMDTPYLDVECWDWRQLFNRRRVNRIYRQSVAAFTIRDVVLDVIIRDTSGFTYRNVQASTVAPDIVIFQDATPSEALTQLMHLNGGGGWYLDHDRDVHFFGTSGETGERAPTPPLTLNNTRSTLMAFNHGFDMRDVRNRSIVLAAATRTMVTVPNDIDLVSPYGIPIDEAWMFDDDENPSGYVNIGAQVFVYNDCFPLSSDILTCVTTADAGVGATEITVGDNTNFILGPIPEPGAGVAEFSGWAQDMSGGGQCFYFTASSLTPTILYTVGAPTSGYGMVATAIPTGTTLRLLNFLSATIPASGATGFDEIPQGESVRPRVIANDLASQVSLSYVEGGDGIHEYVIDAPNDGILAATQRADADLLAFAAAAGVPEQTWTSLDMNAKIGVPQQTQFTGSDPFTATLTITQVDYEFFETPKPPKRHCTARNVKVPDLADVLTGE